MNHDEVVQLLEWKIIENHIYIEQQDQMIIGLNEILYYSFDRYIKL